MLENVACIQLVFENVESIVIPIERVQKLDFGELCEAPPHYGSGGVPTYVSDSIELAITYQSEAELQYDHQLEEYPLGMFTRNPISNHVTDRPHILGRVLNHMDLICIELCDVQEAALNVIYAPWSDHEYSNEWMDVRPANGLLQIHIKSPQGQ